MTYSAGRKRQSERTRAEHCARRSLTRQRYADALALAEQCASDRVALIASLAELVALRDLHRQALRVLRGPARFVFLLDQLPAPGATAQWRGEVERRERKAQA